MAGVTAHGLSKRFGDQVAVDAIDLAIQPGEFYSLLGPSGCGKTTTLRMIAGLELPTAGTLRIGERDVTRVPAHRRGIGMVFQNYALFPHLSVAGNVAYGLKARGVPRGDIASRVERALERVDLAGFGPRRVNAMSGGQQQRVALARAIVLEPSLLLLDEPLSNLDARLRQETREALRELQRELGITTVYVTHDQEEALTLSDRIAVMRHGRLQQVGTPLELYAEPANRFVAEFIGRANLAPVELLAEADGFATVRLPGGHTVLAVCPAAMAGSGSATLCVRPESIGFGGAMPATVVGVVFNGAWFEYQVALADGTRWRITEPNRGRPAATEGEPVRLELPPEACRLVAD